MTFTYPSFMGRVRNTELRPGGVAGIFYEYEFDSRERQVRAGGRSQDFSEARGGVFTDQMGFGERTPADVCAGALAQLCEVVQPGVLLMGSFPEAAWFCPRGMVPSTTPRMLITVNLPEHPQIHGFGFQAPLLPPHLDKRASAEWDDARLPERCTPEARADFDRAMMTLRTQLVAGTADPAIQMRYDALRNLAISIESPYISADATSVEPILEENTESAGATPLATPTPLHDDSFTAAGESLTLAVVARLPVGTSAVAMSPDDRLLALRASGSATQPGSQLQVYETATWRLLWSRSIDNPGDPNFGFSPDGERLIATGPDGTLTAWQSQTGEPLYQLTGQAWSGQPRFSDDSLLVAATREGQRSAVLMAGTGEPVGLYDNQRRISNTALSPAGPWLAVITAASWGPTELRVWDIFTHEQRTLGLVSGPPNPSNVLFSPDTMTLAASLAHGGPVRIWQTGTWSEVAQLPEHEDHIRQLLFDSAGERLALLTSSGHTAQATAQIWDTRSWTLINEFELGDIAWDMAFHPSGHQLATVHGQGDPPRPALTEGRLWDVESGQLVGRMPHAKQVQGLAFSHDGRWVITGSNDGTTVVWAVPQ